MNCRYRAIFLTVAFPSLAVAQGAESYQCTQGELERRVEILYETAEAVPCEVHYYKDTEAPGQREVLWSAANEAGYCEKQAQAFIGKLEGWGWDCGPIDAEEAAPDDAGTEEADDTDALGSGDEGDAPDGS